jgi:hypothetical protein
LDGDLPVVRLLPRHRTTQTQSKLTQTSTLIGIRTNNPSVRAVGDDSCLRVRTHCDRLRSTRTISMKIVPPKFKNNVGAESFHLLGYDAVQSLGRDWNMVWSLTDNSTSYPRRQSSSGVPVWKSRNLTLNTAKSWCEDGSLTTSRNIVQRSAFVNTVMYLPVFIQL